LRWARVAVREGGRRAGARGDGGAVAVPWQRAGDRAPGGERGRSARASSRGGGSRGGSSRGRGKGGRGSGRGAAAALLPGRGAFSPHGVRVAVARTASALGQWLRRPLTSL